MRHDTTGAKRRLDESSEDMITLLLKTPHIKGTELEKTQDLFTAPDRKAFDPQDLVGTEIQMKGRPYDLCLEKIIGIGGRAFVYRAVPTFNGRHILGEEKAPPAMAVKISKDQGDEDNKRLLAGADFLTRLAEENKAPPSPMIFQFGEINMKNRRTTSYMVMELLYPNPMEFLRGNNPTEKRLLFLGQGIHPTVALVMYWDMLNYIEALNKAKPRSGHGDLNPSQVMVRMSPLKKGHEMTQYLYRLDNLQFETVICDPDTIRELEKSSDQIYFTIGFGDPWFLDEKNAGRYSRKMDGYSATASLLTFLTGRRLLWKFKPQGSSHLHKALDWKEHVQMYEPPKRGEEVQNPIFSREDVYCAIAEYVNVTEPKKGRASTSSFSVKAFREWLTGSGSGEESGTLNDRQRAVECMINILAQGLAPPQTRKQPGDIQGYIRENIPFEDYTILLFDNHQDCFVTKRHQIPVPFGHPNYSQTLKF